MNKNYLHRFLITPKSLTFFSTFFLCCLKEREREKKEEFTSSPLINLFFCFKSLITNLLTKEKMCYRNKQYGTKCSILDLEKFFILIEIKFKHHKGRCKFEKNRKIHRCDVLFRNRD